MSKQKIFFLLILVMLFLEFQCKTLVSSEGYELEKQNGKTVRPIRPMKFVNLILLVFFLAKVNF